MKKLLFLTAVFLFSCSSKELLTNVILNPQKQVENRNQKAQTLAEKDSFPEYLHDLGYDNFAQVSDNETVVVTYLPCYYNSSHFTIRFLDDVNIFCKAHNGKFVSGKGSDAIAYDEVRDRADALLDYFGEGRTLYCTSKTYPLKLKVYSGFEGFNKREYVAAVYHPSTAISGEKDASVAETIKQVERYWDASEVVEPKVLSSGKVFGYQFVENPINAGSLETIPGFRMGAFFWGLFEQCLLHGGDVEKDGKPFKEWINENVEKFKFSAYPQKLDGSTVYPAAGTYTCTAPDYKFKLKVEPYSYYVLTSIKQRGFLYRFLLVPEK
jgi:hypothetical protein